MPHKMNIYGVIGSEYAGISAKQVVKQLATIAESDDQDIDLHINSGGGYVDDAVAMVNRLRGHAKEHGATITAYIDGLAASAATLVMLAADNIVMPGNASLMVHSPWGLAIGTASDLRKSADLLDMTESNMIAMYADRTGLSTADVRDLLAEETWMTAEDAEGFGFVDTVSADDDEDVQARARLAVSVYMAAAETSEKLTSYAKVPEWAQKREPAAPMRVAASTQTDADEDPQSQQENSMPKEAPESTPEAGVSKPVDTGEVTRQAAQSERQRITAIMAMCSQHDVPAEVSQPLIDEGTPLAEARETVLDHLAKKKTTGSPVKVTSDEADNRVRGVQLAIEARAGLLTREEREQNRGNRYASMSLAEMAFAFDNSNAQVGSRFERLGRVLAAAGRTSDYWGAQGRPTADIGITHSVSDFTNILKNVANKSMLLGWDEAPSTHEPWTNRGNLSDFREATRAATNLFPNLLEVEENGEYQGASMGDRGNTIKLATYGRTFGISRQALINDDLMAFTEVPKKMGQAAKRTVNNNVYAVLTANASLDDGIALFHADHSNTSAIDITAAGLATLKAAMRTQTGPDTDEELNITPTYIVAPAALEHDINVLINAAFISDGTTTVSNVIGGLTPIIEPRLDADSTTTIYMMAAGNQFDTVEVAYLNGVDAPRLENKDGWKTDGTEFKVGIDFGVAVRDFRGMQRGT